MTTKCRALLNNLICAFTLCLMLAFHSPRSGAQQVTADISGIVNDQSGGALADATVTVTNKLNGNVTKTKSNSTGIYRVHGLEPGSYTVTVEVPGFATAIRTGITLSVSQQLSLDVSLGLGQAAQSIEVGTGGTQIETTSAQVSGLVGEKTLNELPLNGRDLFSLTLLQPGVVPATTSGVNSFNMGKWSKGAAQGTRASMSNVTLDGADINDPAYNSPPGGPAGIQLGVEATSEYRVVLNPYSAEYGRNAGANVEYVSKSGTNAWHGSAYEFIRNSALDARNYFDVAKIPLFVRNQFGASVGGPILRDKMFFFLNYEALRETQSITIGNQSVPNANARLGLLPSASGNGSLVNVGINANTARLMSLYPTPNGRDLGTGLAYWSGSAKEIATESFGSARWDYNPTSKDQFFIRLNIDNGTLINPVASTNIPGFAGVLPSVGYRAMLSWQRTVTKHLLNQASGNYSRTSLFADHGGQTGGASISLLGSNYLGAISVSGLPNLGYNKSYPTGTASNVAEFIDNALWDHGSHTIKFGANIKHIQINGPYCSSCDGSYTFSSAGLTQAAVSNNPSLEDFILGQPYQYSGVNPLYTMPNRYYRQNYLGFYLQDDIKLRRNVTANVGIRWEYYGNPSEKNGLQGNIDNLYASTTTLALNTNRIFKDIPLNLWSPRVGLVWQPFERTSLRAGYGIMRDQIWQNIYGNTRFYAPYYQLVTVTNPKFVFSPKGLTDLGGLQEVVGGYGITYTPKMPYYHEYSLFLDQQLNRKSILRVGYVGTSGVHLLNSGEANPYRPALGRRLNPNFGSTPLIVTNATSHYNALQTSLQQQGMKGLTYQISYTWSRNLDTSSGPWPSDFTNVPGPSQDNFNLGAEKGRSALDRTHVFVANYTYELPFGPGKTVAVNGLLGHVVGGWRWTGILSLASGPPFTVLVGNINNSGINGRQADRPNVVAGANMCATTGNISRYFDPSIYTLPAVNTFGNAPRDGACGPPLRTFDSGLSKSVHLTEKTTLELRSEFFNLFNITNLQTPSGTLFTGRTSNCTATSANYGCGVLSSSAGQITATTTTSRQIQFAAKLMF